MFRHPDLALRRRVAEHRLRQRCLLRLFRQQWFCFRYFLESNPVGSPWIRSPASVGGLKHLRSAASVDHPWMALPILRPALPQLLPSEPCRSGDDEHNAAPAVKPKGGQGSALFVEHRRALLR
jgi:hypothetical protein